VDEEMRIVKELIIELEAMEERVEKVKKARTLIQSASEALKRRPPDENWLLAIEGVLDEAIRCFDE
jgi:hypothetical protein